MRWLGLIVAAASALGTGAGADAAAGAPIPVSTYDAPSSFLFLAGPGNATHVSTTTFPLGVSGQLTVVFRSDPGSGCARLAACGYHGTLMFKPAGAQLTVERYTAGGRRHRQVWMTFDVEQSGASPTVFARVLRNGGGVCADASDANPGRLLAPQRAGRFVLDLSAVLAPARCAGPLPSDLHAVLPDLALQSAPPRGSRIDARHVSTFADHGFAGTVSSTLVFTVGVGATQNELRDRRRRAPSSSVCAR